MSYPWSSSSSSSSSSSNNIGLSDSKSNQLDGVGALIPVINKLQDVFNALGSDVPLDLPQIVVVGSQSSGKSSVLENIVGRDFLPRGSGIVTRRPLVLQLINVPKNTQNSKFEEWGEFLHKPGEVFYNFTKLRDEIAKETDRLTGQNKGISSQPINLKIFSPHVLNLTLVDLPGMTRIPVGDQPPDIEQQIRKMIYQYVKRKNAIILAVTPANTDMATSDALQLAKEVDPSGTRTLGVLTKLDIMDKGTNALEVLLGRVIPLKLGFVGVINRSQQDIISNISIREALKNEAKFFQNHSAYRKIASRCGTPYLSKTLNKRLLQHIRNTLPELKSKLSKMMAEAQMEMMTYGDPLLENEKGALLLQIITRFSTDYKDAIDGKSKDLSIHELCGGARINYIFNEIFSKCIDTFDPLDGLTMNDIRTAIRNATGPRTALFIPEDSFEVLVQRQISRLEQPAIQCVEYVFDELKRIVTQLESKELARFNSLRVRVVDVMASLLNKCRRPTEKMISDLIAIESAYVNTSHPDFVGGGGAMNAILQKMAQNTEQDRYDDYDDHHEQNQRNTEREQREREQREREQREREQREREQREREQREREQREREQRMNAPRRPNKGPPGRGNPQNQQGGSFFNMFFGKEKQQQQQQQQSSYNQPLHHSAPQGSSSSSSSTSTSRNQGSRSSRATNYYQQQASSNSSRSQSSRSKHHHRSSRSSRNERMEDVPAQIKPRITSASDKERFESELIQSLLISYFDIVRKNVKDMVPKSCMHFLVNSSKKNVQSELIANLYKPDLFDELLEESPEIAARRKNCQTLLETLRKANSILNEVRDSSL